MLNQCGQFLFAWFMERNVSNTFLNHHPMSNAFKKWYLFEP